MRKMKTESKHKDGIELRNVGMPNREEELKGKQICLANQIQECVLAGSTS